MGNRLASGCSVLDDLLDGGLERDTVSTVYGPAGSGKTNVCMFFALGAIAEGKQVIYLDTEGNFSVDRFAQIHPDSKEHLKDLLFLKPLTFAEQKRALLSLKRSLSEKIGLVIIDTISMLYRLEFGKETDMQELNRELGRQLSFLTEIARKKKIPVLITNQVYSDLDSGNIRMLGGELVRYGSKCLIELKKGTNSQRVAVVKKHRSIEEGKEVSFKITRDGFLEEKK